MPGVCREGRTNVSEAGEWCSKRDEGNNACNDGFYCGDYHWDGGVCKAKKASSRLPKEESKGDASVTCGANEECLSGLCANDGIPGMPGVCRETDNDVHEWCNADDKCVEGLKCVDYHFGGGRCLKPDPSKGEYCTTNRSLLSAEWFARGKPPADVPATLRFESAFGPGFGVTRTVSTPWEQAYLGDPGNCDRGTHVCHNEKCTPRGDDCVAGWESGTVDGWAEDTSNPSTCHRTNEKRTWIVKTRPGPGGKKCKNPDDTWATHNA